VKEMKEAVVAYFDGIFVHYSGETKEKDKA
jgi:hypothetical protein